MKLQTLLKLIRFWPPFLGSGISVKSFSPDFTSIEVQMKMRFWNKNYVGTHFGGSLYSMTDPFYMLLLMQALGKNYIVWDRSASIHYKKPAKGTVFATFNLTHEHIQQIKESLSLNEHKKINEEFIISVTNSLGETVAEIKKTLYISLKNSN